MRNLKKIFSAVLIFAMMMTYVGAYAANETAVDIDYDKKTAGFGETYNTADGGMNTRGGSAEFKYYQNDQYGADNYLKITGSAQSWLANESVRNAIKAADKFVFETSVMLTEGSALTHLIRCGTESNLFKLEKGSVTVGNKTVAKYENYKWYQLAAVYNGAMLTLYMNGDKLGDYELQNSYKTEGIARLGLWYAPATNGYVAYRYIKIYAADSFDAANYTASLTAKETAEVTKVVSTAAAAGSAEKNTVSTNKTNLADLKNELNIPAGADVKLCNILSDGTYALSTDGTIGAEQKQALIVKSANGKTLKYYDIAYDSGITEKFKMTFENADKPNDTTSAAYTYAQNYKGNTTAALKASLKPGTTEQWPGGSIDKTVNLSTGENFLISGKFALNKSSFNISFTQNGKLTPFNASSVEIKGTNKQNTLPTDDNEWMSFAIYYNAVDKSLATYIDGKLLEKTTQTDLGETIKTIRFYCGFTKNIGEGDVYLDDLTLTYGACVVYNPADDAVTLEKKEDKAVYIHNHTIYTATPNNLAEDFTVSQGVEGLAAKAYGDTLVLKNGNSIKTYLVKEIPQYALVENVKVNSGKTNVTATIYDFDGTKKTYRLLLAEYAGDKLSKVYMGKENANVVNFTYTNGNRYVLYVLNNLKEIVPISGAWALNI